MARLTLRSRPDYLKVHRPDTSEKQVSGPPSFTFSNPRHYALPYLRFSVTVIALFLMARLQAGHTLVAAAALAGLPGMPYQRGQFWVRRFRKQAVALCAALAAWTVPVTASSFLERALHMLQSIGWMAAHRCLFADLRFHLLGWPACLAPDGRVAALWPPAPPA